MGYIQLLLCMEFIVLLLSSVSLFQGLSRRVVPFSIIKLMNSLCAKFVAGGASHFSVLLTSSCVFSHQLVDKLRMRR